MTFKHLAGCLILGGASYLFPTSATARDFSPQCAYSHTLPDDPILYPGRPGQAMVHDFFGNTKANAYSTYESLEANKDTTCNVKSDLSSYWTPQLRRASGIIVPDFQKTYYKNDQPVVPVHAMPPGLQLLAGNHRGTAPNPHVDFLCAGTGGYTHVAPKKCGLVNGRGNLNISVHFPDCWDGVNLHPDPKNGLMNAAYRKRDGTCPADYPVKIPEMQLNLNYSLGSDGDLSTAELSLDPVLIDGKWVPQWGSLYTAHADFFNAWKPESMAYAVEFCSNTNLSCENDIPTYFSKAKADGWMNSEGTTDMSGPTLRVGPGDIVFLEFPTPTHTDEYPWGVAALQTMGQNTTDKKAVMVNLYQATTDWMETGRRPQASDCLRNGIGGIYLDHVKQLRKNDVTRYVKGRIAAGDKKIGICMRNSSGKVVVFSSLEGERTPALFLK